VAPRRPCLINFASLAGGLFAAPYLASVLGPPFPCVSGAKQSFTTTAAAIATGPGREPRPT